MATQIRANILPSEQNFSANDLNETGNMDSSISSSSSLDNVKAAAEATGKHAKPANKRVVASRQNGDEAPEEEEEGQLVDSIEQEKLRSVLGIERTSHEADDDEVESVMKALNGAKDDVDDEEEVDAEEEDELEGNQSDDSIEEHSIKYGAEHAVKSSSSPQPLDNGLSVLTDASVAAAGAAVNDKMTSSHRSATSNANAKSTEHSPGSVNELDTSSNRFPSKSSLANTKSNAASTGSLANQVSPGRPVLSPAVASGLQMGDKMSPGLAKRVVAAASPAAADNNATSPATSAGNLKSASKVSTSEASATSAGSTASATSPSAASTSSNMSTNSSSSASKSSSSNVNLKIQSALERNIQRLNLNPSQKSAGAVGKPNLSKEDLELFANSSVDQQQSQLAAAAAAGAGLVGYFANDSLTSTPEHQLYANYGFQTTPLMAASPSAAAARAGVQPQYQQLQQQQQQFSMNYFYPQSQPLNQPQQVAAASYFLNRMPMVNPVAGAAHPMAPFLAAAAAAQPYNAAAAAAAVAGPSSQVPIFNPSHMQGMGVARPPTYPANIGDREMTPDSIDNDLIFSSRPSQSEARRPSHKSSSTAAPKTSKPATKTAKAAPVAANAATKTTAATRGAKPAQTQSKPVSNQSKPVPAKQPPASAKVQPAAKQTTTAAAAKPVKTVSALAVRNQTAKPQPPRQPQPSRVVQKQSRPVEPNRNKRPQPPQPQMPAEEEEEEVEDNDENECAAAAYDDDMIVHPDDENCFEEDGGEGEEEEVDEEAEAAAAVPPPPPPLNAYSVKRYSNGRLIEVDAKPAAVKSKPTSKARPAETSRPKQQLADQTNRQQVKAVEAKSAPAGKAALVQVARSSTMPRLEEGLSNDEFDDGNHGDEAEEDEEAYENNELEENEAEEEVEEEAHEDEDDGDEEPAVEEDEEPVEEEEELYDEQLDENSIQHSKDLLDYERKLSSQSGKSGQRGPARKPAEPPSGAAGNSDFIFGRQQSTSSNGSNGKAKARAQPGATAAAAAKKPASTATGVKQQQRIKSDRTEYDTDEETNKLLEAGNTSRLNDSGDGNEDEEGAYSQDDDKQKNREMTITHIMDPENQVLIEGVLFRARYLGSTQLVTDGNPTKLTRMLQAQEAVGRIKAPEGESQPSVEVDLFVSTEKIMVLNTDLQEIMMDHSLRSISYIADIGNLVVLMAKRRQITSDEASAKRQTKMICHVFESEEAQIVAQSIGQAFQVAYMEYLKANGIEDMSIMKDLDYQEVLNQQEIMGDELIMFARKECQKEVIVPKLKNEAMGLVIVESGWGSMLPTVVVANMQPSGPSARCGNLNIGDQIISVNGISMVGLPLVECQNQIKATKHMTLVRLVVVPCPPVVEVLIKRPDTKYQLGFSVQDGIICSLLRGGIAERGGVRVGHRIIEINNQSVVATTHDKIVSMLANSVGELRMKTMPTQMFRLLTGQDQPVYI